MDKMIDDVASAIVRRYISDGNWREAVGTVLREMFVRTDVQLHASKPPAKCLVLRERAPEPTLAELAGVVVVAWDNLGGKRSVAFLDIAMDALRAKLNEPTAP